MIKCEYMYTLISTSWGRSTKVHTVNQVVQRPQFFALVGEFIYYGSSVKCIAVSYIKI